MTRTCTGRNRTDMDGRPHQRRCHLAVGEGAVPVMAGRMAQNLVDVLQENGYPQGTVGHRQLRSADGEGISELRSEPDRCLAPAISAARAGDQAPDEIELRKREQEFFPTK